MKIYTITMLNSLDKDVEVRGDEWCCGQVHASEIRMTKQKRGSLYGF